MEIFHSAPEEDRVLDRIDALCAPYSEMRREERQFINSLLLRKKPSLALELGVAAGSSSLLMLNALRGIEESRVFSIDIAPDYYRDKTRRTGFLVEEHQSLARRWRLFTGSPPCLLMDEIAEAGGGVDFCLLDTTHALPGEFLDFLSVFPYLNPDCVVALHDTQAHTGFTFDLLLSNCLLLSAIKGEKILLPLADPSGIDDNPYATGAALPNIGAVILDKEATLRHIADVFHPLSVGWGYTPDPDHLRVLSRHFERHYDRYCLDYFHAAISCHTRTRRREENAEEYLKRLSPVYIFGAGENGRKLSRLCRDFSAPTTIAGFLDNNPKLHGREIDGIRVFAPRHPSDIGDASPTVVISMHDGAAQKAAVEECRRLGYTPMDRHTFVHGHIADFLRSRLFA
jgi:predicted O-methyltransferase YrrM